MNILHFFEEEKAIQSGDFLFYLSETYAFELIVQIWVQKTRLFQEDESVVSRKSLQRPLMNEPFLVP